MKAQGFTSLSAVGYATTRDQGSASCLTYLSLARARNVKEYLTAESRRLHHTITVTAVGRGDIHPIGSGAVRCGSVQLMLRRSE